VTRDDRPPLRLAVSAPLAVPDGFDARLAAIGVSLTAETVAQIGAYLGRLLAMNEQMNLTAIKDAEGAWGRHALDALTLLPLMADVPAGAALVDIGSGGGIPGVVLAIARPDLRVTLVESTQKKAGFLEAVSAALGLTNVTVRAERAEHLLTGPLRGTFDVVTARAVARLVTLAPITIPFARPGGLVLLIKGQRADEELVEASSALALRKTSHEKTVATPTGRIVVLRVSGP
jgi:16S rRNA (guanine527-N7)-methyltransferase